ncbi:Gfo/Idh/MocA family protein [Thalassotalea sp. PLHSN55]|uniref:Gfo/Idh/MocA family protein n=1 Tax=Thalassotalea sp. PLHSN55 TaxID=3435888 RepID=UPI003F861FC8
MDYTKEPIGFKLKKVFRYVRMYGPSRTVIKVKSQLHMKNTEVFDDERWINPKGKQHGDVAIVGCGNFSFSTIAYYVTKKTAGKIKYALDVDKSKSLSLAKTYNAYCATNDYQDILNDSDVKIVYIASNHASHAEYAIEAIKHGKSVHIEKPHVVREEQMERLEQAMLENPTAKVFLGFNRPQSKLFKILSHEMSQQSGNSMLNWFVSGHEIEDGHWYFSEEEGGRILGNLCHWSDLCIHLVGKDNVFPCTINPANCQNEKSNFSLTINFNDGSQAAITFSAKGHTFEGVREYLNVHKGDLLASLQDFHSLTTDVVEKKNSYKLLFRDHGHQENIVSSYINTIDAKQTGEDLSYIKGSALLVLKIKEAVDTGKVINCTLNSENP